MNAHEYLLNRILEKRDRELRFPPLKRGDEDASDDYMLLIVLI
jgi:hypothetical protein